MPQELSNLLLICWLVVLCFRVFKIYSIVCHAWMEEE